MISIMLDFSEFIDSVKNKDKNLILTLAETEAKEAEKISEIMGTGSDYVDAVMELIYLLRHSQKPVGIKDEYLHLYRAVCEKLVLKKQISPELLEQLKPKEKHNKIIGKI